jgi:predicted DNA-binding ribbon-helix-helix protein
MIKKRSLSLFGHRTSISLEEPFWLALQQIACEEKKSLQKLIENIDEQTKGSNLSSRLRVFVLNYYKALSGN